MSIDDELTIIYHLLYQFGDFLLLGGECFVRASKCRNRWVSSVAWKKSSRKIGEKNKNKKQNKTNTRYGRVWSLVAWCKD